MKGDQKVLDYLNQALRHELTAVHQFWMHYRLMEDWGFGKLAGKWREEADEERGHADRLIARIVFLDGHPDLQTLNPLRIGQNVREVLENDLAIEYEARDLYKKAREVSHDAGDYVTKVLFEEMMADEEGHIDFLETQIGLYDRIGAQNYGQLDAASADEQEKG